MRQINMHTHPKGNMLITVLVLTSLFVVGATTALVLVVNQTKLAKQEQFKEQAFQAAEAGVEFYRWHLAHVSDDFVNDTGLHEYKNAFGSTIGYYNLEVIPPSVGSTVVTINSTGWTIERPNVKRTISVQLGIPSFATFAVVANDFMRFGAGTEVFGPIHSNGGVRFDGIAHNVVSSAKETFVDPDTGQTEDGVYTTQPDPSAVFLAGTEFPVPAIDFNGITVDLANIKLKAQSGGVYLAPSNTEGYHITFQTDGTMDMWKVNSQALCRYRFFFWWYNLSNEMWSINTESEFTYEGVSSFNVPIPANGIIFAEDNIWIDGQIDGARLTVVAAEEPLTSGNANIIVNTDLLYTNYDGTDVIGLIAQNDFYIGYYSNDNFRIDAAIIAQKGRVGRPYYPPTVSGSWNPANCNQYIYRDTVTTWGAIATYKRYGFAYTNGTGYDVRNLNFDTELIFAPPPSFPTTGQYTVLSWEEK